MKNDLVCSSGLSNSFFESYSMTFTANQLISYYRASVADVSKLAVDLNSTEAQASALFCSRTALLSGRIGQAEADQLFAASRNANRFAPVDKAEKDGPQVIEIVLMPYIFSEGAYRAGKNQRRYPLICVPALLQIDGILKPRVDGVILPWIPREMLEPVDVSYQPTVGSVEAVDEFLNKHSKACLTIGDLLAFSEAMVESVTGKLIGNANFVVAQGSEEAAVVVLPDTSMFTFQIAKLYRHLEENNLSSPLAEQLATGATRDLPVSSIIEDDCFIGTMNTKYGLAWTQRISANHVSTCATGNVIAVNGPPGTGKTTLLAALIADSWSKAALAEAAYPPLVVVASTNNKAVTNVNDSLFSVAAGHERWISGIASLGLYLSPKGDPKYQRHDASGSFFANIEDANWLAANKQAFLTHASKRFEKSLADLASAKSAIHAALKKQHDLLITAEATIAAICGASPDKNANPSLDAAANVASFEIAKAGYLAQASELERDAKQVEAEFAIQVVSQTAAIGQTLTSQAEAMKLNEKNNKVSLAWLEHLANESLWFSVVGFLPSVQTRRDTKRKLFWAQQNYTEKSLAKEKDGAEKLLSKLSGEIEALKNKLATTESERRTEAEKYATAHARLLALAEVQQRSNEKAVVLLTNLKALGLTALSVDACLQKIDAAIRSKIFNLAMHYWEARYLQELSTKLADQNYDKANIDKSRQARMYRRFAMLTPCFVATFNSLPKYFACGKDYLLQEIDLLIAEEAGQISPEVAFCSMALAKRLVAVGDIYQLEPVWNLPESVDLGNARGKLSLEGQSLVKFFDEGYAVSSGCIMKVAQHGCAFRPNATGPKGFTLTEHRRCVPEIIEYCNTLVYNGVLEPMRPASESKVQGYLPAMGWAHIAGNSERAGTSWSNDDEAIAIADWVFRNKERLEASYAGTPLHEIIAIISPLKPHASLIARRVRDRLGANHGITIDSVHSLQGAERFVVIFAPGYGVNHTKGIFFDNATNLMNVAVSRAKDAFLVFGNMNLLDPARTSPLGVLGRCLFKAEANNVLDVYPVQRKQKKGLPLDSNVKRLSGRTEHLDMIQSMFSEAQERVVVASPFITKSALTYNDAELLKTLKAAVERGVKVQIFLDHGNLHTYKQIGYIDRETLQKLASTGASIFVTSKRFHNKTFCRDGVSLIEGSFNWLSAPRYESGDKHECSTAYSGTSASAWIEDFMDEMKALQAAPLEIEALVA